MNILIYNWRDIKNPDAGGAEVFTHENAKRWVNRGHSVTLFASAFRNCKSRETVDGVRIIRDGGKYSVYWKAYRHYKKEFRGKFDMVVDEINTLPFFTPLYVKERKITLIHQMAREFWFYETSFPVSVIGYLSESCYLKMYKNLETITVSKSTRKDLVGLGFKKVSVVSEGINFSPLKEVPEKEKEPTMIFVGRLKKAKKPDDAVKTFRIVRESMPDARLWVVGEGYFRKDLEKMSVDGVRFFGHVSGEEKLGLMRRAHVILVPGVREGWGLIVTEANACGTPAIAYDVHGLRDSVKDGKTGLLTENNPESMAKEVLRFFEDDDLRDRLTRGALKDAWNYDWNKSAEESLRIIEVLE